MDLTAVFNMKYLQSHYCFYINRNKAAQLGYSHPVRLLDRNIFPPDEESPSIDFKISNSKKWSCCVRDQSLSASKAPPIEKILDTFVLLDYTLFLCKINMASRRDRSRRSDVDDRERGLNASSRNSPLYQNSLPIAKKVSQFGYVFSLDSFTFSFFFK